MGELVVEREKRRLCGGGGTEAAGAGMGQNVWAGGTGVGEGERTNEIIINAVGVRSSGVEWGNLDGSSKARGAVVGGGG